MRSFYDYNVLSMFYEDDDLKIARVCQPNSDEKVILKIVRKKGGSTKDLISVKQEFELLKDLNKYGCRHIANAKRALNFELESCLVLKDVGGVPLLQACNHIKETSKDYIGDLLDVAIDLVEAVEHIHWMGILHNDCRSDKILADAKSRKVVIIDFSCALSIDAYGIEPEKINKLKGLYSYISPERTGRTRYKVDQRSDLYSLGIILYEIFSGYLPFMTKDISDLVHCHIAVNPPALADVILDFPVMISSIIQKLMRKELTDRYQSAKALKSDLLYCREQWNLNKAIPIFELGCNDYFGTICFPQKIYGREKELLYMKEWFEQSRTEKPRSLLVSGYSGIGKTTLVEKSYEYFINEEAFFVKGKFEQSKMRIPYFALSQLLVALINRIMKEDIVVCKELSNRCSEALGEQAGALIPIIPNLENFLGKQKEVTKIDPKQAENRMYHALEQLLKTLTTLERPLIFFIDDIQWADGASMDMISNILNMGLENTFLICAYRENEIEHQFKLKKTIELWEKEFKAEVLHLRCLEKDYTQQFVADSLRTKYSEVKELADVIQEKTEGNIFFTRQFLLFLHNKGMLHLHSEKNEIFDYHWHWNIKDIRSQCPTENVIDIILDNLKSMPKEDLNIIEIASCIGNCFDVDILTSVCNIDKNRMSSTLFNFRKARMIIYDENKAIFSHDRIHQVIYSMASNNNLAKIHLKIGKVMLKTFPPSIQEEKIFDITFQWNRGASTIRDSEDMIIVAKLNLKAARKAKENSAYIEAKNCIEKAMNCLSNIKIDQNYKLALELYNEMSELNLLLVKHEDAYAYAEKAMAIAKTMEEKFDAFQVCVRIKIAESRLREAVDIACEYVELLGEKVERNNSLNEMNGMLREVRKQLGRKPAEKIAELPEMTSYRHLTAIKMLTNVLICSYMVSPAIQSEIVIKMIELFLKYGNTSEAPAAWAYYANAFKLGCGNLENGYNIGKKAIEIGKKLGDEGVRTKFNFNLVLAHRKQPMRDILNSYLEIHDKGLKIGDLEYACQGLTQYGSLAFHAGCNLAELEKELEPMLSVVGGHQQKTGYIRLAITLQVIINLRHSNNTNILCGRIFDEYKMIPILKEFEDGAAIFIWTSQKIMLCCLFGKYKEMDEAVRMVEQCKFNTPGQIFEFNYHYYLALCKLRKIKITENMKEQEVLEIVNENLKKVEEWVKQSETNYIQKYLILKAEFNRAIGKQLEALKLYNDAIENASENNFIQDTAFALELLGLYHLEMKNMVTAEMYLQKASEYYEKWGAFTKVEHIREQYLSKKKEKLNFQTAMKTNDLNIDLHSILLAAQTLSQEIEIHSLIKKMMQIVLVNSGATKAIFLEYGNRNLMLETGCIAETDDFSSINFINCVEEKVLPWSFIRYTLKEQELILSDNPLKDPTFSEDLYIQQEKPKSVLCIPLSRKDNLVGVIYLENKIFSGAFTSKQIEVIKMISAQIVISLENARLYSDLEEKVKERTAELNDTVLKLESEINERKNAEEALYENEEKLREVKEYDKLKTEFFANISHELKTPLNVIYSAIQMCNILINNNNSSYKQRDMHKYIQMSKQNCYRLLRLINNIIDITKFDSGYLKPNFKNEEIVSSIENIVMSVVNYAELKGISITFDTDVEERIMACDIDKIERIILNLLSNAMKFTEKQGNIYVNIFNKEKSITISIKDTGIGIPKEKLDVIFERFVQVDKSISRNNEGSGIGLYLVKALVIMHNGSISVNSEIGKGSEFIIEIPVYITNSNILCMEKCEDKESSKIERINIEFSDIYF